MGRQAKVYDKEKVKELYIKYGSINDVRIRTGYGFTRIKEILIELGLVSDKSNASKLIEDKGKWSKAEMVEMNASTLPSISKGMAKGYFSRSVLRRNGLDMNVDDYVFAYSPIAKAFIKMYKSDIAFKRYKERSLQY